uniref:Uncharacterized protein n=1 Tax=Geoglobus ahangari TaxID=113653 RepID=A0A7C3YED4_9EURY
MKLEEFVKIRRNLRSFGDFKKYKHPRGTLFGILSQKKVDFVKRTYHNLLSRLPEIEEEWKRKGRLPKWLRLPPVLRLKFLMKSLGFSDKEIDRYFKNPHGEFEEMIWNAIYTDYLYSPIAAKIQVARGRVGELMIRDFLESLNVEFKCEKILRPSKKTPDFFIEDGLEIDGRTIRWIESKALFGDLSLHRFYSKKQYDRYLEIYGDGLIIYWLGKLDNLDSQALIKDYTFIPHKAKNFLLEMKIFFADKKVEDIAEILDATVWEWESDEVKSKKFLNEILDLFQRIEGNIIITNYNGGLKRVFRNMGFDIITFP